MRARGSRIFFLLVTLVANAQEVQKDSVTYLEEVIVSDPGKKSDALGITSSAVIGPAVFEQNSPVDLPSAFNQIAGVYLLSGAMNTNRITIRGVGARTAFGTDKLRLYFNDIPVTDGTGFSTIEAFDLETLGALEVIKGPKGTAFGSRLGGAVMLRSKAGRPESTELVNHSTLGSYALFKNHLGMFHNSGKFSTGLHFSHMDLEGYRENSRFDRDALLLNPSWKIGSKGVIGLLVNHIDYRAQIPSSISKTDFEGNPRQAAITWKESRGYEANAYTLLGIHYNHDFNRRFSSHSSLFYSYLDHYEPRPFNILDEFTNSYGFRSRFAGTFGPEESPFRYQAGAELFKDEYSWGTFENLYEQNQGNGSLQGAQLSDNQEFRREFNAFATLSIAISDAFTTQLGLSINKTNYTFMDRFHTGDENRDARRNFDAIWLPSLDLEYRLSQEFSLYANLSRGFSNPSLEETLTPEGVINPDIKQESGNSYEIGGKFILLKSALQLDISLYRMDIRNLLVARRVGQDEFIGRNAGSTEHQGLETEIYYRTDLSSSLQSTLNLSYSYNDHSFVDFIDGDNNYSGNTLTGIPRHRLFAGWRLEHSVGLYWFNSFQHVAKIPLTDAGSPFSDAFSLWNTKWGYRLKLSDQWTAGLDFGINNAFDTAYAPSVLINAVGFGGAEPRYYYPGNGRNVYGSLQLAYRL